MAAATSPFALTGLAAKAQFSLTGLPAEITTETAETNYFKTCDLYETYQAERTRWEIERSVGAINWGVQFLLQKFRESDWKEQLLTLMRAGTHKNALQIPIFTFNNVVLHKGFHELSSVDAPAPGLKETIGMALLNKDGTFSDFCHKASNFGYTGEDNEIRLSRLFNKYFPVLDLASAYIGPDFYLHLRWGAKRESPCPEDWSAYECSVVLQFYPNGLFRGFEKKQEEVCRKWGVKTQRMIYEERVAALESADTHPLSPEEDEVGPLNECECCRFP